MLLTENLKVMGEVREREEERGTSKDGGNPRQSLRCRQRRLEDVAEGPRGQHRAEDSGPSTL